MVGYQAVLLCLTVTHVLWQREDQAIAAVRKGLSVLEAYLQTRTYLTGHRVTLADVIVSSNVYNGYTRVSAAILAAAIFTQFPADHSLPQSARPVWQIETCSHIASTPAP